MGIWKIAETYILYARERYGLYYQRIYFERIFIMLKTYIFRVYNTFLFNLIV